MSLLAPLYFLGGLAIGLPILFHLIRRQPQGEVPFSSLMFLRPTPPRLTRRSRLENWPLLLVRAMIIGLLAAAFARPLVRNAELADLQPLRTASVLLVDTSASMQRTGLWDQAIRTAQAVIDDLQPGDQLAIVSFDLQPHTRLSFDLADHTDLQQLKSAARNALRSLSPSWNRTDMGRAIRFAAELATGRDGAATDAVTKVILVSDLSEASRVESLQAYAWPDDVTLDIQRVAVDRSTNAFPQILIDSKQVADQEAGEDVRVRVQNSADSNRSSFRIGWDRAGTNSSGLPIQVPPGQSRVVRLPIPESRTSSLTLTGDDHDYDNQRFYVVPESTAVKLLHVGPPAADPRNSLIHFLNQAPLGDRFRTVSVDSVSAAQMTPPTHAKTTPLLVIEEALPDKLWSACVDYLQQGGRILAVLADADRAEPLIRTCNAITKSELSVGEAIETDYAMLSKIEFRHPLFAPFSEPPFNDFSKIRFWSHRSVTGMTADWSLLASFDDGTPALLERNVGQGKFWILTAGWQPEASQLALSTKFVPLLFGFFDPESTIAPGQTLSLGDPIPFDPSPTARIRTPSGDAFDYRRVADSESIDRPGIYQWSDQGQSIPFAVNLAMTESRTLPIAADALEQFGVQLDAGQTRAATEAKRRQLRDRELEGRQKIWQWLLAAALTLIGLETWLGSRVGKPIGSQTNEPSTT